MTFTISKIKTAGAELATLNRAILRAEKIQFVPTEQAPSTYKALSAWRSEALSGRAFPVYSGASENAIYSSSANIEFRAVHDWHHLKNKADFSRSGELRAILSHYKRLKGLGATPEALRVFLADTAGQVWHYYTHKSFLTNQIETVRAWLNSPRDMGQIQRFINTYAEL